MLRAFGSIVLFQTFAQKVRCHSDDRVDLRIEIRGAPQGVNRDVVFLDIVSRSLEVSLANKAQDFGHIAAATECLRIEERIQLRAFDLEFVNGRFHSPHPKKARTHHLNRL
jgi:hypothetical protein